MHLFILHKDRNVVAVLNLSQRDISEHCGPDLARMLKRFGECWRKNGRLGCLQMACGWCRWRVLRKKCFLFKFKGNAKACRCLYNIILCISQPYKAECMGTKMQHCWFKLKILETCENFQRLGMDFRAFGAFAWLGCSLLQLHHVAATCRITSVTPLDKVCQYKEGGHF